MTRGRGSPGEARTRPRRPVAIHGETARAWDIVARAKYRDETEDHLAFLRDGGHPLLPPEERALRPHLPGARVVHLQCSHGLDTLGLLNAGAARVTGLDISGEMIRLAREKTRALGWSATFVRSDVLDPPEELLGSADLVYTGKGALPWVMDLAAWAGAVARVVRPGGRVWVFEGHPLCNLLDRTADAPRLRPGVSYFDDRPRENPGFPTAVVRRAAGTEAPRMRERFWRPGEVMAALLGQGLVVESFAEHAEAFWDEFPGWTGADAVRLPRSYSILARRDG